MRTLFLVLLSASLLSAEVLEVIKLYRPLSLKGTESFTENKDGEVLEAGVFSAPAVLSGAMPEDILAALTQPYVIQSYGKSYESKECNLFTLSNSTATAKQLNGQHFEITLTLDPAQKMDLNQEELTTLLTKSIRNTFTNYFNSSDVPLEFDLYLTTDETRPQEPTLQFTCGG